MHTFSLTAGSLCNLKKNSLEMFKLFTRKGHRINNNKKKIQYK